MTINEKVPFLIVMMLCVCCNLQLLNFNKNNKVMVVTYISTTIVGLIMTAVLAFEMFY